VIVIDASAAVELLLGTAASVQVRARLLTVEDSLHAPHLIDLEVLQALRRHFFSGALSLGQAEEALADFSDLSVIRYPHDLFLPRIWELRHNVTAYDAAYLALAEALDAPLVTCDKSLASSSGHRVNVELV